MSNKKITYKTEKQKQGYFSSLKGHFAELFACFLLFCKGYRIASRNFSCGKGTGRGEIDIIARKSNLLVFVEVKYRSSKETAYYAVTAENKNRVTAAAEYFIGKHPKFKNYDVRFDAVIFDAAPFPKHIKDAWRPKWY